PKLELMGNISLNSSEDFLILCAGFEDRSVEILKKLISNGSSDFNILLIKYLPELSQNKFDEIQSLSKQANIRIHQLVYDRERPLGIGEDALKIVENSTGKILIDISAMSRLLVVQIIVALLKAKIKAIQWFILYTEANQYPPTEEEVRTCIANNDPAANNIIFLSSGVFEVTILPELSSISLQGQPIRLITFPSFNVDQLAALRTELQPSFYNFVHGAPPSSENAWRPKAIQDLNQLEEIVRKEDVELSTLDYTETLDYLLKIYDDRGTMDRIIISPIGSKMQAVATGILRAFVEDIQIVYPTPRKFTLPEAYTRGVKNIYVLPMKVFSDFSLSKS
ncbi:MAG: hypothetical protein ACRDE8_07215, partial [Ginsengibacter sp.]